MHSPRVIPLLFAAVLIASGCSVFPGLRVLTGQDTGEASQQAVAGIDLVMADKSGGTDPSLLLIGDRIEAANQYVDVIELRDDLGTHTFTVNMVYLPPQVPNTAAGAREQDEQLRRTVEIAWQAALAEADDAEVFRVVLLFAGQIPTLDHGPSFIGQIEPSFEIDRGDAAGYLSGTRSLQTFYDLILNGTLRFSQPDQVEWYAGSPNHPMFVMPSQDEAN